MEQFKFKKEENFLTKKEDSENNIEKKREIWRSLFKKISTIVATLIVLEETTEGKENFLGQMKEKIEQNKKEINFQISQEEKERGQGKMSKWMKYYEQAKQKYNFYEKEDEDIKSTPNRFADIAIDGKDESSHERAPIVEQEMKDFLEKRAEQFSEKMSEKIKKRLKEHIASDSYFKKLVREFNGDELLAIEEQAERLRLLENVKTVFKRGSVIYLKIREDNKIKNNDLEKEDHFIQIMDMDIIGENEGVYETFDVENSRVILPIKKFSVNFTNYIHEYLHASTRGDARITKKAKLLLEKSFISTGYEELDRYLSDPSERLTRKQMFDFELERLGIKKYGEKFTDKHLEQVIDFFNRDLLSNDAKVFLETTKIDYIFLIMNGIAENDLDKNNKKEELV